MKILVIASSYPTKAEVYRGIFVKNLVEEFVRQGCEVIVIAPQKRHENKEVFLETISSLTTKVMGKEIYDLTYPCDEHYKRISWLYKHASISE